VVRAAGSVIPAAEAAYKPFIPRSYAYCSDTAPFPEEAQWLKGTTVLYHETTYTQEFEDQGAQRHHSTTLQAAAVAREAGVQKLLIGHYSSRSLEAAQYQAECRSVFPETYATSDGDTYDI
jgi:ribonuclease Z